MWGMDEIDKDGVGPWDVENAGKLVYDKDFDLSIGANQLRM